MPNGPSSSPGLELMNFEAIVAGSDLEVAAPNSEILRIVDRTGKLVDLNLDLETFEVLTKLDFSRDIDPMVGDEFLSQYAELVCEVMEDLLVKLNGNDGLIGKGANVLCGGVSAKVEFFHDSGGIYLFVRTDFGAFVSSIHLDRTMPGYIYVDALQEVDEDSGEKNKLIDSQYNLLSWCNMAFVYQYLSRVLS